MPSTIKKPKQKKPSKSEEDELNKMDFWYSWYSWSECKMAKCYDEERNFFPEPGPSTLNYYENDDLTGYYRPLSKSKTVNKTKKSNARFTSGKKRPNNSPLTKCSMRKSKQQKLNADNIDSPSMNGLQSTNTPSDDSDWENDIHVQSFYEQSFVQNTPTQAHSPILFDSTNGKDTESVANTTISTPVIAKFIKNLQNSSSDLKIRRKATDVCTIKPMKCTPRPIEINNALNSNEFPKVINKVPFYSDPNDVIANSSKKEIGNTVLHLTGNALNNCDDFNSKLNVVGMYKWQQLIAMNKIRTSDTSKRIRDLKTLNDPNSVRKLLAKEKLVRMTTHEKPPTNLMVNDWLKIRAKTNQKKCKSELLYQTLNGNGENDDNESPEKIQREKTLVALDYGGDDETSTQNDNKGDIFRLLRSKKEITVSFLPKRNTVLKSQSDDENKVCVVSDDDGNNNYDNDDGDDDDVVCLDDAKQEQVSSFAKLVRFT